MVYGTNAEIAWNSFIDSDFHIDDQHSYIGFKIKYFGFSPVRGRFNEFSGTAFYSSTHPEATRMTLAIKVASINTGNSTRDNDLITGDSWFNETRFPYITYDTESATRELDGTLLLFGTITLNGVSKKISINFKKPTIISRDWAANEQVDFSATLSLNRKEFNIKGDSFWDTVLENGVTQLSDEVLIELDIHTRRPDYEARFKDTDSTDIRKRVITTSRLSGIDAALQLIKKEEKNPSADALTTIGRTLLIQNKYSEAIAIFEHATTIYPKNLNLYNLQAIGYLKTNNLDKADSIFNTVLEIDPNNTKAKAYKQLLLGLER